MNSIDSIDDFPKILAFFKESIHSVDHFHQSFVERRVAFACKKMNIFSFHEFENKLSIFSKFLDEFMFHFTVPTTELFRDFTFWKVLYHTILPQFANKQEFKIWMPDISTGEELYSLCILLQQLQLDKKATIYASHLSLQGINFAKKGMYPLRYESVYTANHSKIETSTVLSDFFIKTHDSIYFNASLLKNVEFIHNHSIFTHMPNDIDIILFRNSLLYYNKHIHYTIISSMYNQLVPQGYLMLGLQDSNTIMDFSELFKTINKTERIYQKK